MGVQDSRPCATPKCYGFLGNEQQVQRVAPVAEQTYVVPVYVKRDESVKKDQPTTLKRKGT